MKSQKSTASTPPISSPVPLPFNPAKLRGISEKLIVSHHDHNYSGTVKNLNAVRAELAALPDDTPAYRIGGLRAHELTYGNSVTLHEHYFGNLGGNGKADGAIAQAIPSAWGHFGPWDSGFRPPPGGPGGGLRGPRDPLPPEDRRTEERGRPAVAEKSHGLGEQTGPVVAR